MVQSQLSAYSGSDPIWGFVALVGSELFTGEASVGLDPRVRLFAVNGRIYFAEREDDAAIATRLVNCGAVTAMQLARGSVRVAGHESLARMFQRDATIDRDAVELTIATSTESLLASIAQNPVGMPEVFPLRYHPAGIHHWLRGPQPMVADDDEVVDEVAVPEVMPVEAAVEAHVDEAHIEEVRVEAEAIVLADEPVTAEEPVAEVPYVEVIVEEVPFVEVTVDEVPPTDFAEPITPVLAGLPVLAAFPVIADEPLTTPALDAFPAPTIHAAEVAVPEWPKVDDEPAWAVPPDVTAFAQHAVPVEPEPVIASAVVPITAAHLPQLAPLHSIQIQPTPVGFVENPNESFEPPLPVAPPPPVIAPPAIDDPLLPKLAAGPMSIKDLKRDLQMAPSLEPWSSTSNNMAAVQIWEMVDDLCEDPKTESVRVGSNAPEARGHGWRRKKG